MATYTKIVDPDNGPGTDYTSLAAWEAGEQSLYTSGDIAKADCRRTGTTNDSGFIDVSGWVTGVDAVIESNPAYDRYVHESSSRNLRNRLGGDLTIIGLRFNETSGSQVCINNEGAGLSVQRCELYGSGGSIGVQSPYALDVLDCIIFNFNKGLSLGSSYTVLNCTIVNKDATSDYGIYASTGGGTASVKNTIVWGHTDVFRGASNISANMNISDTADADSNWTNNCTVTTQAASDFFTDYTNNDFRLKSGSDAVGGGADLGTTPTGVNIDIDGRDRDAEGDTWDIGAHQLVSGILPIILSDVGQAQSLDSVSLTQKSTLSMNNLTQGMSMGSPVLSQAVSLIVQGLNQEHISAGGLGLTQKNTIDVAGLAQGHAATGGADLIQQHNLNVAGLSQAHGLGGVSLTLASMLQVANMLQAQGVDDIDITQAHNLAVNNLSQTQDIGSVDLSMALMLEVAGLSHSHTVDALALSVADVLVVDDLGHSHSLGGMTLSEAAELLVNDLRHSQNIQVVSFVSLTGKVTLTFDMKIPGVDFSVKTPGVTFDME